ncbi:MAG TPA: hypothetical protein VHR45_14205 [Thermoanaerobaculia bacterium]|nr:hypothetical protein [Thermoanaerobaculia bacterium]
MNPDVAQAIPQLEIGGILPPGKSPLLLRVARGELLSVRGELRALLYAGVLLITGGVGVLVKENLDQIGPLAIAAVLGLAAAAALAWVAWVAPPFSWEEAPSPNLAFDYILLLGILLAAADLAYVEVELTPLGASWPWHLLLVAVATGLAALRFDSRVVFSLALSTFAAWRGVSVSRVGSALWTDTAAMRWNAVACGALFALLGLIQARTRKKAHFEPVAVHFGWLLLLGGMASGLTEDGGGGRAWAGVLLAAGAALAAGAYRARRFPLFAYGVIAAYLALSRLVADALADRTLGCFCLCVTSILMVLGLLKAHRRMREPL